MTTWFILGSLVQERISNNSFVPNEISYLDNRFCNLANKAKRYIVKNGNDPTSEKVTEEKESELEAFIDYAKIIIGTLGHKVFEPLDEVIKITATIESDVHKELVLYMKCKSRKSGHIIEASCKQTNEGFVVMNGSHIETIDSESIPIGIKKTRETSKIDENGLLQENVLFRSPSYAAAFVIGGHANGLTEWKTAKGKTLREIEAKSSDE